MDADYERRAIATALVSVVVVAILIIVVFTAVRVYLMRCQLGEDSADDVGTDSSAAFLAGCDSVSAGSRSTGPDLDGLKVDQLISHGRYGDVYRGLLGTSEVAVKVKEDQCADYYVTGLAREPPAGRSAPVLLCPVIILRQTSKMDRSGRHFDDISQKKTRLC